MPNSTVHSLSIAKPYREMQVFATGRAGLLKGLKVLDENNQPYTQSKPTTFNEPFAKQAQVSMTLRGKAFKTFVGKGKNAGNQHFLLFQECFQPYQRQKSAFYLTLFCRLQMHYFVVCKWFLFGQV